MKYGNENSACGSDAKLAKVAPQTPRGPFTAELRDRIERLYSVLGASEENLSTLRAEKMGPWPISDAADGSGCCPSAEFDDILARFDHVISRADNVAWHSQVLRNSI